MVSVTRARPFRPATLRLRGNGWLTGGREQNHEKTNFDRYLEEQMKDPEFAARFDHAGEVWDVALQIVALRQQAGLSQKRLAKLLKTSQQQISRLESPGYEGHSLSTLRRVAAALHARVCIIFEPQKTGNGIRTAKSACSKRTRPVSS